MLDARKNEENLEKVTILFVFSTFFVDKVPAHL